jgi:chaperone required for assembly of F1-ATPase
VKRFWKDVSVGADRVVALDGRPVRTPGRVPLSLPTDALAQAVAAEWRAVGETVDPRTMPITGLANAAIDRIAPDPAPFIADLARYAETDLLCYRADAPADLVARQRSLWDPPLAWARTRYDVHFALATGIVHRPQPDATVERLAAAVAALDPFRLAAMTPLVSITGSLVLSLAILERAMTPDDAWSTALVDEDWQAERWGVDPLAEAARTDRRRGFDAAAAFLAALGDWA